MVSIYKLFYRILSWFLRMLDGLFNMFQALAGTKQVDLKDRTSTTLIDYFLSNDVVTTIFWFLFIISIFIAAVCVVVSVIKSIVNMKGGERKPHAKSLGQGLGSILVTIVMAIIMIVGISVSNTTLRYVNNAFYGGNEPNLPKQIIDMSIEEAYEIDYGRTNDPENIDDDGNYIKIYFKTIEIVDETTGEISYEMVKSGGWYEGCSIEDYSLEMTPDEVFGYYKKNIIGMDKEGGHKEGTGIINIDSFNFVLAYIAVLALLVVLGLSALTLVKRLYDIVLLFLSLPLISGTIPLNDGAYFKIWRETVISKVILAYGAVISVNVFMIVIPLLNNIDFVGNFGALGGKIFHLLLIIGGALSINGGQLLFARLFGTSAEESREMMQAARGLIAGGAAGVGLARGLRNATVGGHSKYGVERKGLFRGGAKAIGAAGKIGGKTLDSAGKFLGGNAYKDARTGAANKAVGMARALKGTAQKASKAYMGAGGALGIAANYHQGKPLFPKNDKIMPKKMDQNDISRFYTKGKKK